MTLERQALGNRYDRVRARTTELARPLADDDQLAQAFPDASPTKWHLGHTTWFFERFVLATFDAARTSVDPHFEYVFNSYYEAVGPRQPRHARSLAVRPTLAEVRAYRERIDHQMRRFFREADERTWTQAARAIELGTHHEEQHQELLLTDVKALLAVPGDRVGYPVAARPEAAPLAPLGWCKEDGGRVEIGHDGEAFAFDNESPRHREWLEPFELASRCVTSGEYLAFVESGGYASPALWLSDGWARVREHGWTAPAYWRKSEQGWLEDRIGGRVPLDLDAPVSHVSYYEADAFARWSGATLPTEAAWEHVASREPIEGNSLETGLLHPQPAGAASQLFFDVWEWTASPYAPYPRYRAFEGAFAEYNGKFMCSQMVLRGGSCFTPREHVRGTYRNFFPPEARWQMTGFRLARWR